jgi:hypothetical protein
MNSFITTSVQELTRGKDNAQIIIHIVIFAAVCGHAAIASGTGG